MDDNTNYALRKFTRNGYCHDGLLHLDNNKLEEAPTFRRTKRRFINHLLMIGQLLEILNSFPLLAPRTPTEPFCFNDLINKFNNKWKLELPKDDEVLQKFKDKYINDLQNEIYANETGKTSDGYQHLISPFLFGIGMFASCLYSREIVKYVPMMALSSLMFKRSYDKYKMDEWLEKHPSFELNYAWQKHIFRQWFNHKYCIASKIKPIN